MKKGLLLLFSLTMVLSVAAKAQVDPAQQEKQKQLLQEVQQQEQQKLQDELLKQQQKEAEELLKQQQKQREKEEKALQKQQEKEQQQLQKQQEKEQRAAEKEQEKAQAAAQRQQEKEQRAAEKAQARKEKRDSWGRGWRISVDPTIGVGSNSRFYNSNSLLNARSLNGALAAEFHYPIGKKVDLIVGVGYKVNFYSFTNSVYYDEQTGKMYPQNFNANGLDYYDKEALVAQNVIQVPIKLSFVSQEKKIEWYVGVVPGYSLGGKFTYYQYNPTGSTTKYTTDDLSFLNRFRCELVFGEQKKLLFLDPGVQVYFNLMPTYVNGIEEVGQIHEFGIRFTL